ncbi:MAG TPA: AIR synthase related protein, partial [Chloroflexota bacterium]|nr:AIR synthase related protein [Chloroflexota bacterium]
DVASKASVFRRYDWSVQTRTVIGPGQADAAVLRLTGTSRAIALAIDGNGRYCYLDPYQGGAIAVAEAARNVVCAGGEPIAATDCLNFGNPEKPEIYYQLEEAIRGMSEACRALATPIVGGNVSLYNESNGRPIYPTPIVGMLGLLDDAEWRTPSGFQEMGDSVWLLGDRGDGHLGGTAYLAERGLVVGPAPRIDLVFERHVQRLCQAAIRAGLIQSAHDVSDGGLGAALAEACIANRHGLIVTTPEPDEPLVWLFNEAQSRIVISTRRADGPALVRLAAEFGVPCREIGTVDGDALSIPGVLELNVDVLARAWSLDVEAFAT